MVLTHVNHNIVDIQHIYFIRAPSGPIHIGVSKDPKSSLAYLNMLNYESLELLTSRPGDRAELQSMRVELAVHHIKSDWFAPSPEVLEYVAGKRPGAGPRAGVRGRKLTQAEALEIFRLCHETGHGYAMIGARYGVSVVSVSKIARGRVFKHLFRREPAPVVAQPGTALSAAADMARAEYISENRPGAAKYRIIEGRKGTR